MGHTMGLIGEQSIAILRYKNNWHPFYQGPRAGGHLFRTGEGLGEVALDEINNSSSAF